MTSFNICFSLSDWLHLALLLISCQVLSNSLWLHELSHARLPCSSLSPWVCSDLCPLMPSNHLIHCHPLLLFLPSIFPNIRIFSSEICSSHQVAKVLEFQLQHWSFLKNKIFTYLAVLGLSCSMPDLHTFRYAGSRAHRLFSSCFSLRFSCLSAVRILVPWPGIKPESPAFKGIFSMTGSPGKPQKPTALEDHSNPFNHNIIMMESIGQNGL